MQLRKIVTAGISGIVGGIAVLFVPHTVAAMEDAPAAAVQAATARDVSQESGGQSFEDLQAVAQSFADKLGRLKEQDQTVPPEQLVEQADAEHAYPVSTEVDSGKRLDPETVYARSRPGVVVVGGIFKCTKCQHWHARCASGFVIRPDGLILTNLHVVASFGKLEAVGTMTEDGRVFPVKAVIASSRLNDLAVLKVDAEDLRPLPVARDVAVGATVYCLSHPLLSGGKVNGFYTFSKGMVCGKFTIRNDKQQLVKVLGITAEYGPGSSGGPILNEHGAVVAVACQAIPVFQPEHEKEVQMVWRLTRPSCGILDLLSSPAAGNSP